VSDNGWRDSTRRASAKAGIADARRQLKPVEIVRVGAVYRPECCRDPFGSLTAAEVHITSNECEGGA
jgi:hypothetical protein